MLYNSRYFFYYYYIIKRDFSVFGNRNDSISRNSFLIVIRLIFKDLSLNFWGRAIILGLFFMDWFVCQKPKFLFSLSDSNKGYSVKAGDFSGFQVTLFGKKALSFYDFFINLVFSLFYSGLFYQFFFKKIQNIFCINVKFIDILFYFNIVDYEYLYDLYSQFYNARLIIFVVSRSKCFYRSSFLFGSFQLKVN